MMKYTHTIYFALLFLVVSCGDNIVETPENINYGYQYFPVEVGYTWEYQIDSVLVFQGGDANIITSSFVQEKVTQLLSDDGNEKVYRLERSHKSKIDGSYALLDIWQITLDAEKATKTEENLKFIKLVFPALTNKKWDGNAFFDSDKEFSVAANNVTIYQDWNYKIEATGLSQTFNDIEYNDVLHVSHIDEESLINKRFSDE